MAPRPTKPATDDNDPLADNGASASATDAPADDGLIAFTVTAVAPPGVAGRLVRPGDTLRLSEYEALAEELAGHIHRPPSAGQSIVAST